MDAIALAIPFFFLLMGLELAWSAWSGRKVYRFNDFIANMGCGIGSQIVGAFTKAGIFAVYVFVHEHYRLFTLEPSVITWVVTFLFIDLLYYWFHRLSHGINFLWAAHIVHHQSEEYNLSVALRQSWWQGLFSFWFYIPVALLGVDPITIVTVGAFVTLYQFWIHTKALGKLGPLELVFNTPSHHRVHHGSDPKYIDKNHAGTLIIWDKLFGTFQVEEEEPIYGITTPLNTWDPLTANFHYYGDLIALARQAPRWQDKAMVFLAAPGWRPAELGGFSGPVEKDRSTYRKFDTTVPRSWEWMGGAQFALLLTVASYFLFMQQTLTPTMQWVIGAIVIWWVMDLGLLMEGRRWALISATLRSVVLLAAIATLNTSWPMLSVAALTITLLVGSLLLLRR